MWSLFNCSKKLREFSPEFLGPTKDDKSMHTLNSNFRPNPSSLLINLHRFLLIIYVFQYCVCVVKKKPSSSRRIVWKSEEKMLGRKCMNHEKPYNGRVLDCMFVYKKVASLKERWFPTA